MCVFFFFASRRRHTRCALVTGVQTCALPIYETGDTTVGSSEFAREDTIKTGEIGLRAKFRTGGIGHTINASVNHFRSDSHTASMWYGSTMSNLYDPVDLPRSDVVTYRSEEHTSELQSLMRISYAVFCLKKKQKK